jgi:hypothetical protein
MRTLIQYITESKKDEAIAKNIANIFSKTQISKDVVIKMLSNLDIDILHNMSDYYYLQDSKNYIIYQPASDLFIDNKKQDIIPQIADYIIKFIAN